MDRQHKNYHHILSLCAKMFRLQYIYALCTLYKCAALLLTHLCEGEAAHESLTEEHHPSHPEEQDVMTRLKEVPRIEELQVFSLKGVV